MKKISLALLVVAIVVFSFLAGSRHGREQSSDSNVKSARQVLYYVDPMNPGFRSEEPGTAPCGMPLEPVYAEAGNGQASASMVSKLQSLGAVQINPDRQQLIGIKVDPVAMEPMMYSLRLYGKIVPDETRIYRINASTDSWVRTVSDVTTGSLVKKDQILAEVLAPAFYNAQVTYLVALNNVDRIRQQLGGELRHQQTELADNQIRLAVQALQNLGITDAQVEVLANNREAQPYLQVRAPAHGVILSRNLTLAQWFKAGEQFYSIADLDKVWVYADVYEDEAMLLRPGMEVKVLHQQMGRTFDAKVGQVLPLFDPVAKTLKVRLDVDNPQYDLRPDMFVDVEMPLTMPPSLHVPADALIDSGTRKIVYVKTGESIFEPRQVETGWRLGRQIEITSGLMAGEEVIVSGNFLVDSESRMRTAGSDQLDLTYRDPVCGMVLDKGKAEASGKISAYEDETYYFCSEKCKNAFEKEPVKFAQKAKPGQEGIDPAAMAEQEPGWRAMLESANDKDLGGGGMQAGSKAKDTVRASSNARGVVDWDGKMSQPTVWRKGWGKFPGAEYLGLKKAKRVPEQQLNSHEVTKNSPAAVPSPSSGEHHAEVINKKQQVPGTKDAAPHANP